MTGLRAIEENDLPGLANLLPGWFRNTNRETWWRRFENWWTLNPAFTAGFSRGWVLEENGNVVGFIGNVPVQFVVGGEPGIAAAAASWYVDPSVRGMASLSLFNQYLDQDDAALFLFKTENANLVPVLRKFGFQQYPCLSRPWEYRVIVDRLRFIRGNISSVAHGLHFPVIDPRAGDGSSGTMETENHSHHWHLFERSMKSSGESPGAMYTCSLCTKCDDSFTRLWYPLLESYDIAMSRDPRTLNWLYFVAARRYDRKVIQCRRSADDTLVGYMVFDFSPWSFPGSGAMKLMDMRIAENDPQVLASLVSFAMEVARQNNTPSMRLWADSPEAEAVLRKKTWIKVPVERFSLVRVADTLDGRAGTGSIFPCMIDPPRGIDH